MTRRVFLAVPTVATEQIDACELEAVAAWNRFAQTAERYLKLRQDGVRSVRERERMERQFAEVMRKVCF